MKRWALDLSSVLLLLSLAGARATEGWAASIPPGTQVQVRLGQKLETGETQTGQAFTATIAQPVVVGGKTVLAQGAKVRGRVIEAVSSGRLKGNASLTLELTQAAGAPVRTEALRVDGKSHLLRNAALIGGAAAAGALIGGATSGKKGAAVGAAIGAGAGTVTAYMTGKQEIVLPAELTLMFVVSGAAAKSAATTSRAEAEPAEPAGEPDRTTATLAFSASDQDVIRSYFQTHAGNLPPGLAKRGGKLPPGLERHLQRNGTLPPGFEKRVEPFPVALEQRLPRLTSGYSRVILAGRALIIDRNNKILDLMFIKR